MALEIEVLEDTTATANSTTSTVGGVAVAGEAEAGEESLKDDVYDVHGRRVRRP